MKEKEEFGEWITKRSMIKEDGTLDYKVLKRNLNLFIFPASIPLFVFLYCIIPYYFSNIERTLALLLIAAVTAFGTYCSLILSAMLLNSLNNVSFAHFCTINLARPLAWVDDRAYAEVSVAKCRSAHNLPVWQSRMPDRKSVV